MSRHLYAKTLKKNNPYWYLNEDLECQKVVEHNKKSQEKGLVGNLDCYAWRQIKEEFDNRCAYSMSFHLSMDHFIPQSIGHGGTYVGNVYPLDPRLNSSKGDKNPLELGGFLFDEL
ncbi:MAG: hypothetical protein ACH0QD_13140 [Tepidibacillus sp.]